jgi:hypothetical protein
VLAAAAAAAASVSSSNGVSTFQGRPNAVQMTSLPVVRPQRFCCWCSTANVMFCLAHTHNAFEHFHIHGRAVLPVHCRFTGG